MENIYNGLMRHGFSESEAGQVLGENWFNFLKDGLEPQTKG
jgi:microsomal dipeptidase-like Zn-dependent dipeptidase